MRKKYLFFIFLILILAIKAKGQDPQYSQFFAAPLYLNPAFTGTAKEHRLIANYRNQWPNIPKAFVTYSFSYDYNMKHLNSGFGILFYKDQSGSADFKSTNISLLYSYKVHLGNKWVISPALQFGYGSSGLDYNKLVFGDQLSLNNMNDDYVRAPSLDPAARGMENAHYFDFSSGILAYSQLFWGGFSISHINEPNESLLAEEDGTSILHRKLSVHGGVRIPLYSGPQKRDRISSIAPSFIYKKQANFDQLDLGLHFHYNPIMAGVWYRGIPIQQTVEDNRNHDAVSVLFGLRFDNLDVGYSYDLTISKFGPRSGGAHEISLIYQIHFDEVVKRKRPEKFIPCPTF